MTRPILLAPLLSCLTLPVSAQTSDGGFDKALSPSLAGVPARKH